MALIAFFIHALTNSSTAFHPILQSVLVCIQMYPATGLQCVLQSVRLCTFVHGIWRHLTSLAAKKHAYFRASVCLYRHTDICEVFLVSENSVVVFNSITCSFQSLPALKRPYAHTTGTYGSFGRNGCISSGP